MKQNKRNPWKDSTRVPGPTHMAFILSRILDGLFHPGAQSRLQQSPALPTPALSPGLCAQRIILHCFTCQRFLYANQTCKQCTFHQYKSWPKSVLVSVSRIGISELRVFRLPLNVLSATQKTAYGVSNLLCFVITLCYNPQSCCLQMQHIYVMGPFILENSTLMRQQMGRGGENIERVLMSSPTAPL